MSGRRNMFSPWWIIVTVCLVALVVTTSGCYEDLSFYGEKIENVWPPE